jgi:methyltransferase
MPPQLLVVLVTLAVVFATMIAELLVSRSHERLLFGCGGVAPPDPVYPVMRLAYPGVFVVMAIEGALSGPPSQDVVVAGAIVFAAAKALKFWAIRSLGPYWTYRVIVVPGAPLVRRGPYRWLRHPNYIGVVGELIGTALLVGARVTGPLSLLLFGYLLMRRITAEERALQLR